MKNLTLINIFHVGFFSSDNTATFLTIHIFLALLKKSRISWTKRASITGAQMRRKHGQNCSSPSIWDKCFKMSRVLCTLSSHVRESIIKFTMWERQQELTTNIRVIIIKQLIKTTSKSIGFTSRCHWLRPSKKLYACRAHIRIGFIKVRWQKTLIFLHEEFKLSKKRDAELCDN